MKGKRVDGPGVAALPESLQRWMAEVGAGSRGLIWAEAKYVSMRAALVPLLLISSTRWWVWSDSSRSVSNCLACWKSPVVGVTSEVGAAFGREATTAARAGWAASSGEYGVWAPCSGTGVPSSEEMIIGDIVIGDSKITLAGEPGGVR